MFCGEGRLCKGDASDRLVVTVWFGQKKKEKRKATRILKR